MKKPPRYKWLAALLALIYREDRAHTCIPTAKIPSERSPETKNAPPQQTKEE